jgi:hypothetical protein
MSPAERPPAPPSDDPGWKEPGRDDQSVGIVFDMVKIAIDLQFRISERIDSKIRVYFGFAATVYAVAQAIVLKDDVHNQLGAKAGTVSGLAIAATVALVLALTMAVYALRPEEEQDVSEENLRKLLTRGYKGDLKAGADGVNLLIGQLNRRKATNKTRTDRLTAVIIFAGVAALIAFLEVALAVEAVT